ncbi:MAG: chorismate mutase [Acaryochloridaceae cyanobacterium SU_2_1]|nr:chorismate mutase [Acaryochloridaceae cyanobacterium SU_2_1]
MKIDSALWRVRAIRGATTASSNSIAAIEAAVTELMDAIETQNALVLEEVVSVTFSVTQDLDAIFPAAIARQRPNWDCVALLDVQQMHVESDLDYCIRCLIHFNTPNPQHPIHHVYLNGAKDLRPDWMPSRVTSTPAISSH